MNKLKRLMNFGIDDAIQAKKNLDRYINSVEFFCMPCGGRKSSYLRAAVHLNHIISAFRMEESNIYEPFELMYEKNKQQMRRHNYDRGV